MKSPISRSLRGEKKKKTHNHRVQARYGGAVVLMVMRKEKMKIGKALKETPP